MITLMLLGCMLAMCIYALYLTINISILYDLFQSIIDDTNKEYDNIITNRDSIIKSLNGTIETLIHEHKVGMENKDFHINKLINTKSSGGKK